MGFCIGNHEEYSDGCTAAAKGIGLDSSGNWYNNDIVMGNSYNYVVLRGNLLFVYMGGDRSDPNDYSYNLPTPADFYWLRTQVEWADNNQVNVIIVTHTSIFNSTISYTLPFGYSNHDVFYDITEGKWKNCEEHTRYNCDFDDPWPGDNHWTECDDYWDLIENYGNINLWFSGHVHTSNDERGSPPHKHAGWDTTLGVERDIQKSEYCTFVNCGAVFAWGMPWSFSRILTFTEGSKSVDFKSYDHEEHCYGHDTGWKSSHQDIMITSCLKYPFDPYFNPSNNAPNKPNKPEGETKGKKGAEYEYSSKTFDPENDQIYYLFRWSDGTDSGWLGPYDSGEGCSASHTWDEDGAYIVRVKSKDVHGSESVWSNPLNVMMPKPKSFPHIFYLKLSNYFQKIEKVVKKVNQII